MINLNQSNYNNRIRSLVSILNTTANLQFDTDGLKNSIQFLMLLRQRNESFDWKHIQHEMRCAEGFSTRSLNRSVQFH